jgi:hypothetical protein
MSSAVHFQPTNVLSQPLQFVSSTFCCANTNLAFVANALTI